MRPQRRAVRDARSAVRGPASAEDGSTPRRAGTAAWRSAHRAYMGGARQERRHHQLRLPHHGRSWCWHARSIEPAAARPRYPVKRPIAGPSAARVGVRRFASDPRRADHGTMRGFAIASSRAHLASLPQRQVMPPCRSAGDPGRGTRVRAANSAALAADGDRLAAARRRRDRFVVVIASRLAQRTWLGRRVRARAPGRAALSVGRRDQQFSS